MNPLPPYWRRLRARYLRDHRTCAVCPQRATEVDHVVPRSEGGTHEASNLQALCQRHHSRKTALEARARAERRREDAAAARLVERSLERRWGWLSD